MQFTGFQQHTNAITTLPTQTMSWLKIQDIQGMKSGEPIFPPSARKITLCVHLNKCWAWFLERWLSLTQD